MSKNKDNMTQNRWELIKKISQDRVFVDKHRNGTHTKRGGKLVCSNGTYVKPEEAPTWQELMKGEAAK